MKIGMMDSGLGGLTVLSELNNQVKGLEIFYYADQKNCPYGEKSIEEIEKAVRESVDFLLTKKIEMLVLACNTATAIMLNKLQRELSIPVIGVIDAGVETAINETVNNNIAIWATKKTVEMNIYEEKIKEKKENADVFNYKCEKFVPYIEGNQELLLEQEVEKYVKLAIENDVDTIVLGCTHYPLAKNIIEEKIKERTIKKIKLVNPAIKTVEVIKGIIKKDFSVEKNKIEYYTSGNESYFQIQLENLEDKLKKMEGIK